MVKRTGRLVAAAGALLVLVGGVGRAEAAVQARAQNVAPQPVSSAYWAVVVQSGTMPATGPQPPMTYSSLGTYYAVMTNIGTVKPGSLTFKSGGGLTVISVLDACTTQWTGPGNCPATSTSYRLDTTNPIVDPAQIPGPGVTWWLKISTVATVGATLSANVTAPAATVSSS